MVNRLLGIAVLVTMVSGCGSPAPSASEPVDATTTSLFVETSQPASNEGGFGAPAQTEGEFPVIDPPRPVRGELRLAENGCWYITINEASHLVIFPIGSAIAPSDATIVEVPDGTTFGTGVLVDGMARWFDSDLVPGGGAGRWGNYVSFCRPEQRSLAVLDSMELAFDPDLIDDAEIEALVAGAHFSKAWPCGRGWAVSTEDELVGLFIYQQIDSGQVITATVSLPADEWSVELIVGKHLFVNHCDDVFESWEPDAVIAARWPISGGTISILDDLPTGEQSAEVRAVLSDAFVTTATGTEISVDRIDLFNRAFNFFAG